MAGQTSLWKGALAGAIAGAAGTLVMNYAHQAWSRIEETLPFPSESSNGKDDDGGDGENATSKAARKVGRAVLGRDLEQEEAKAAGKALHWLMGVGSGAVYGMLTSAAPLAGTGLGVPFGATLWAVADEGIVPLAGLGDPPSGSPPSVHAEALFSHVVYGVVTDLTRRAILEMIE